MRDLLFDSVNVPVCFLVSSERLRATRQPNRTDPVIDAGFFYRV